VIPDEGIDSFLASASTWRTFLPTLPDPTPWELSQDQLWLAIVVPFALLVFWRATRSPVMVDRRAVDDDVPRAVNTPLWRRLWWKVRRPHDLMRIDGLVVDRSRKPHCLWSGPTGGGKSASVATVRVNGERPTLIVTPDVSDPMRDAVLRLGGVVWTACVSRVPFNFLLGEPTEVAERLTEVFRSGGVGAWKRAARRATAEVIRRLDARGEPRSLQAIGELLQEMVQSDRELKVVCAGWVSRFLDLADQFGSSIGTDGLDLADLLNQGKTVLLDNDSFDHPSLGGDVVALGLAEAKRCASLVPQGFRLIFEEAGQLGERIDLADPFFRAGRRRRIAVDTLTQAESDLDEAISANTATRVYFAQELKSLQRVAADRLGLDYRKLDPANMADFTAWVAHGKIRRLVRFPKPRNGVYRGVTNLIESRGDAPGDWGGRRRIVVVPIERVREVLPALPPPSTNMQTYLEKTFRERGCLRWRGKHDAKGYGYIYLEEDEKSELVHRWRWKQAYGDIGRDPVTGKKLTLGHRDSCFRDCSDLTHLTPQTRGDNSRDRWAAERNGVTHG